REPPACFGVLAGEEPYAGGVSRPPFGCQPCGGLPAFPGPCDAFVGDRWEAVLCEQGAGLFAVDAFAKRLGDVRAGVGFVAEAFGDVVGQVDGHTLAHNFEVTASYRASTGDHGGRPGMRTHEDDVALLVVE